MSRQGLQGLLPQPPVLPPPNRHSSCQKNSAHAKSGSTRDIATNTIIIVTGKHFLYHVGEKPGTAVRYGVGVGRAGLEFKGSAVIGAKKEWPSWTPTKDMIKREPENYAKWADGMPGGPENPLGARALYLFQNGADTFFRIHGTTVPRSIGTSVSNGCIRMINEHVTHLYDRVSLGTKVIVV